MALKNLSTNHEIVIKPSDKGGNVILMDVGTIKRMHLCILENSEWYRMIPEDVTTKFREEFSRILLEVHQRGINQ